MSAAFANLALTYLAEDSDMSIPVFQDWVNNARPRG